MRPNLFDYATSELSQDAFLCWLSAWGDPKYKKVDEDLWKLSQLFLSKIIDVPIDTVEVDKQFKNIDVWVKINDKYFIIIEDKKGTSEHSDQLNRYANVKVYNKVGLPLEKKLIYFKMEEQSDLSTVTGANFTLFKRSQMLEVLSTYISSVPIAKQNQILVDFYDNLLQLDTNINSYKTLLPKDWKYYSWMGFFASLQKDLGFADAGWSYVSNAAGGFMGFWWNFKTPNEGWPRLYLQLHQEFLTIRIASNDKETNAKYKEIYQKTVFETSVSKGIVLEKYGSIGKSMGIYKLENNYIIQDINGKLEYSKTLEYLKEISTIVTKSNELLRTQLLEK